ncbi:tripartite tricarboxylate transporter substrate binding protein [Halomonas sp. FeN2]|jgi:tripartite-type tricarboxylate transporter receptor subunit TctC|uniref:Tripartite tricarboxylate transporter substrate binding protein n=1 Tax=Vreelandella neptunia TaxID=115551 RepID=A0ABZ0YNB2_9GAMM|nr:MULTISPECIES: tripartite tricarboxylate transporter substrate binding protein [Halomonas]TDV96633.1 tripartite-type tricarboxylate transporter receptor subunit TctC [Halomonas alkaliantarctica]MBF58785.1 tripartite tricarboxylate transporter substrate-binding protein [Halomonas sp.]MBL1267606.1 tripartite tricarboxylate transporter substrate binding protein [Halomonas sp.]MBL1270445.1 tripartite tricarboxylate transporter substrate binding protein [Halomonas sp.]MDN3560302.1 tripartite tric|tara:strand:- start:1460 stop:2446 length:987 start_codon:yes stop_codon:yes gene_type:complete
MNKLLSASCLAAFGSALALGLAVSSASANEWPTDDIRLVVPYAPGGTTDVLSRRVADLLQQELDANVVVENRPGAGSTVGTGRLARGGRDADHTILMASPGHTIGAAIYPDLSYDPVEDFVFLQNMIDIPNVMVVPADSPYESVIEFVEAAKEENMTFSHSGVGSSIHMSGELFKTLTETNMTAVPFAGSGAALPALLGGDVDVSFENMPTVLSHIRSGDLRALAVTSAERSEYLPDVPTLTEVGEYNLDQFVTTAWFGLVAHSSFPEEAQTVMRDALAKVMEREEFVDFADQLGAEPGQVSGEEFKQFIADEVERWQGVAQQAGISQ